MVKGSAEVWLSALQFPCDHLFPEGFINLLCANFAIQYCNGIRYGSVFFNTGDMISLEVSFGFGVLLAPYL